MLYNTQWEKPVVNPVAKLLNDAADLLEKHGHIKHLRGDFQQGMCFLGALNHANGSTVNTLQEDGPLIGQASKAVFSTLAGVANPYGSDNYGIMCAMAQWNNAPERTGREVIDAMRNTAAALVEA